MTHSQQKQNKLQDIPGNDGFDLGGDIDFSRAWEAEEPFLYLKNSLYEAAYEDEDYKFDYPYESIFNRIVSVGMVKEAHKRDAIIEVRYGWEPLDSDNVMMHSCRGMVVHPAILMDGKDPGFILELSEEEDLAICAFRYKDIFWILPIRD